MATYKYQQNFFDGASAGYVKYNITPDFDSTVCAGETITITGQAYCKDMVTKCLTVNISSNGAVRTAYLDKTIPKGTATTFKIEFTMWELGEYWGTDRLLTLPITFSFCDSVSTADESNGTNTMAVTGQEIRYLRYRISVSTTDLQFERYSMSGSSYIKDDEGTYVMGSLGLSVSEGCTASDVTVAAVKISSNENSTVQSLSIPASAIASALAEGGYVETAPTLFSGITFDTAYDYTLLFEIGDTYNTYTFSVLVARAFANVHMSGCPTGGVALGKFSSATENNPKFECTYPAYFDEDIQQDGKSLFWNAGDTLTIPANYVQLAGIVTSSNAVLFITIPVGKPIRATSVSASGYICVRTIKGYINSGSTDGFNVKGSGYTTSVSIVNAEAGWLFLRISKSSAFTNVTNNTPIVAMGGATTPLTLTFS